MSYKRVVKKRGKTYGPYIYQSYRDKEGNVKKRYLGKVVEKNNSGLRIAAGVFLALFFLSMLIYTTGFYENLGGLFDSTGHVSFEVKNSYIYGENLTGNLNLKVKDGELIPGNAKIVVEQQGNRQEFDLGEFVELNLNGSYYVEGQDLGGQGDGYGFIGEKTLYPEVYFTLLLSDSSGSFEDLEAENETFNETIIGIKADLFFHKETPFRTLDKKTIVIYGTISHTFLTTPN